MKISLNWLKKYVKVLVPDEELVRLIGARLVEVEGVIDETHKYDNIYIVRVEQVEKIPETHLSLCQINNGKELVQVVCGAPNVREGMLAVWIAPGAVVPASVHEDAPFVIGKRKMRGFESCGMLAGADELDFGDDHSGIVEIDPESAQPGDMLTDVFELNDWILEIENKSLTHRPDCFGMIGFAREVAGILGQRFEYKSDFHEGNFKISNHSVSIEIASPDICPRYLAVVMEKHGEMKKKYLTWMDTVLSKSGMKPISPIVDVTNYLMLLTGQPLHAFDYDKFLGIGKTSKPEIKVRVAREGEKMVLLDQKEVVLISDDIVICSGNEPVALAGAMGGQSTMIDDNTNKIIIESATFSLYHLRKTQMAHGIFSEAITRFTKGLPPAQTMVVAEECAKMLGGGFRVVDEADKCVVKEEDIVVKITTKEINALLGTAYDEKLIVTTLENVGFMVQCRGDSDEMVIKAPSWRMDIHIKEDIIEEVGRLLGYDNIEPVLPKHFTAEKNKMHELKHEIRALMSKYGANEVLTYSFVSERLLKKAGQEISNSYSIVNSISPDLQFIRQAIVPSLLGKAYLNEKLPVEKFAIYEMNGVYRKDLGLDKEKLPIQKDALGCVIAERKNNETAYYKAKKYVAKLLEELGVDAEFVKLGRKDAETKMYEPKRSAEILVEGDYIGVVGEFKASVKNEFKLAPYLAGFEVDLGKILQYASGKSQIRFGQRISRDLTVTTDKTYAEELKAVQKDNPTAIIAPGSIYQAEGQETRNITFHITEFNK